MLLSLFRRFRTTLFDTDNLEKEPLELGAESNTGDGVEKEIARERGEEDDKDDLLEVELDQIGRELCIRVVELEQRDLVVDVEIVGVNGKVEQEEHARDEYEHFSDAT